jgi:multicomponent Na+:H+ antiporter subunit E
MCPTEHLKSGFCTMASLQPGLLPAGFDADGNIAVHCLDVTRPVAQQLAEEERRFLHAVRREPKDA